MASGPICAMVWEGRDAVKTGRTLLGATNPLASAPGTIRGDFAIVSLSRVSLFTEGRGSQPRRVSRNGRQAADHCATQDVGRNVCHGSDSVESAKKEIDLWFKKEDVVSWKSAQNDWIYEKP
ncbi:MAG: hypothetical protein INR71_08690 [Terriglobus roseus]|nr:hypothetical protein [Terriglobus roseus]